MTKKLYIKTWGCQMNVYDSQKMADVLAPLGYAPVEEPEGADMVILNTCHIREKATDKVFSELGRLRDMKTARANNNDEPLIVAVAGCVAQAEGDLIASRAPYVDLIFGPQTLHRLPEMVAKLRESRGRARVIDTEFPPESKFDHLPATAAPDGASAFISIQEGCDKFCTFCVVPYTRGAEYSRPVSAILDEARALADKGVRDITLLGQNVNAYHGQGPDGRNWSLGDLIFALADIQNIAHLRYMTSHPNDMHERLYEAHRDVPQLMPFLHLPVQSGSDEILARMNRKHTASAYLDIINRLRADRPDMAFSSDFIVGFPGETDAHFEETIALVKNVGFAASYSFKYSARPGTPAAALGGLVARAVMDDRLQRLQALLLEQMQQFNASCVGRIMPVLLDKAGQNSGELKGRTPYNQSIAVSAPAHLSGQILPVLVTHAHPKSLAGTLNLKDIQHAA